MANLDDPRLAPVKTRKKAGRKKIEDDVTITPKHDNTSTVRLRFPESCVERLLRKRDGAGASLNRFTEKGLRLERMSFTDASIPAAFFRLEKLSFDPRSPRLRRFGRAIYTSASARMLKIKKPDKSYRLKTLWINEPPGLLVIFPDDWMLDPTPKIDAELAFGKDHGDEEEDPGANAGV